MEESFYSFEEVLQLLNASDSTVKNWIKLQLLKPIGEKFPAEEVQYLKNELDSGELKKFQSRANKTFSVLKFVPSEYIDNRKNYNRFMRLLNTIEKYHLNVNEALMICSLKLLVQNGLTSTENIFELLTFEEEFYSHQILREEIAAWCEKESIDTTLIKVGYKELFHLEVPMQLDSLGVIYQSLQKEGKRSIKGAYYTPQKLVDQIIADVIGVRAKLSFLDPCCGTGQFLISAAKQLKKNDGGKFRFSQVVGYDRDAVAVRIARINFLLFYKNIKSQKPNIFVANTLLAEFKDCYDVVATNPPWGARFSNTELKKLTKKYPSVTSRDSYAYFAVKCLRLTKPGGKLSLILPESILYTGIHSDIREYLVKNTTINRIEYINRLFKRVFTAVLRMDFENQQNLMNNYVKIKNGKEEYSIRQERFSANEDYRFDIFIKEGDKKLIDKIYERPHTTLKNNAKWALGVVTGNNSKHLSNIPMPGSIPIISGKDVSKFMLVPSRYIVFEPTLYQQVASVDYYKAPEKLIYRFIGDKLIFAYDNKKLLTLNSANILIPHVPDYSVKVVAALFNSKCYQFLFQKQFNSIKILRQHLEVLPLPLLEDKYKNELEEIVDKIVGAEADVLERDKCLRELDDKVDEIFNLTEEEKKYLNGNVC